MRLKKVKNADEIVNASDYVIKNPTDYKGKYNKLFKNNNPICVEIGMGKGDFIIGMAQNNPNVNYVGIEMFSSVLVRAVQKLEDLKLNNVLLINMDASNINEVFDKEIDAIYLNFSDPWPKKRHAKRRLTSRIFLEKYDDIFKNEKKIIQKTDNIDLFEYSMESLTDYGYELKTVTRDLYKNEPSDNVRTEYEKKFIEKDIKICMLKAYKR